MSNFINIRNLNNYTYQVFGTIDIIYFLQIIHDKGLSVRVFENLDLAESVDIIGQFNEKSNKRCR